DLGSMRYFLGLEVLPHDSGLHISQVKYTLDLFHRNSMTECKPSSTPLAAKHHLTAHDGPLLNNPTEFRHLSLSNSRPPSQTLALDSISLSIFQSLSQTLALTSVSLSLSFLSVPLKFSLSSLSSITASFSLRHSDQGRRFPQG
ncbi:hypothetical protein GBA52_008317, partial [Prunus armeniaca]